MQRQQTEKKTRYVVEEVEIALIDYAEQQVRETQVDDEIHELASSIDSMDLLQFPGVVRDGARYQLAWGRRRLEAFKLRRAKTIPCRIYEGNIEQVKALALVENLQRRQMSIEEECAGVAHLVNDKKLSVDQITAQLGRSRSWVLQRLAVPNYPGDVREALLTGQITLGAAEVLGGCEDNSARAYILSQAVHAKLTVGEIRGLVQMAKETPTQQSAIDAGLEIAQSGYVPQDILIACAACHQPRKPQDLLSVRVCNDGCKDHSHDGSTETVE